MHTKAQRKNISSWPLPPILLNPPKTILYWRESSPRSTRRQTTMTIPPPYLAIKPTVRALAKNESIESRSESFLETNLSLIVLDTNVAVNLPILVNILSVYSPNSLDHERHCKIFLLRLSFMIHFYECLNLINIHRSKVYHIYIVFINHITELEYVQALWCNLLITDYPSNPESWWLQMLLHLLNSMNFASWIGEGIMMCVVYYHFFWWCHEWILFSRFQKHQNWNSYSNYAINQIYIENNINMSLNLQSLIVEGNDSLWYS